jgi:hypothetical protein
MNCRSRAIRFAKLPRRQCISSIADAKHPYWRARLKSAHRGLRDRRWVKTSQRPETTQAHAGGPQAKCERRVGHKTPQR